MKPKSLLRKTAQETYMPINAPYIEEKADWVTPAVEVFRKEWRKSEYFKKYCTSTADVAKSQVHCR